MSEVFASMTPERLVSRAIDRRYERYELQGIDRELNQWGRWIEMRIDYEGYPSVSAGMQLVSWGSGIYGDRILCLDMPTHIYATHGRVIRLAEHERDAVWIWYVIRVKPDGTLWPIEHKCHQAGISEQALRQRISRARRKIAGLPALEVVESRSQS